MGLGELFTRSTKITVEDTATGAGQTFTVVDDVAPRPTGCRARGDGHPWGVAGDAAEPASTLIAASAAALTSSTTAATAACRVAEAGAVSRRTTSIR
jgi:hypothetical protein